MRVLHLLTQKPGQTGSGVYLQALMAQAPSMGIEAAALVGVGPGDDLPAGHLYPVRFETRELPFPVVGMSDVMPYSSARWSEMSERHFTLYRQAFQGALRAAVESFQPDIVHCHHLWHLTALARESVDDLPVVASCHGTGLRQKQQLAHQWRWIESSLTKLDHIFCLTPDQLSEVSRFHERCSVVGAGFDPTLFHPHGRSPESSSTVLYAGKLSFSKGCRELLRAVEEEPARLSLAGSGSGTEAEEIRALAQTVGATLLGRLDQPALAEQMRQAEVFVLPSYYEGLPLVVAEALSCGCKVVVTDLPGLRGWFPEEVVVSDWVQLVELPPLQSVDQPRESALPDFVQRLKEALGRSLSSSRERPRSLHSFLNQHTWAGVAGRILRVYERLVAKR